MQSSLQTATSVRENVAGITAEPTHSVPILRDHLHVHVKPATWAMESRVQVRDL